MSTDDYDTKPTIETVLEQLADFRSSIESRFDRLESRFDSLESRFEAFEVRLTNVESRLNNIENKITLLDDKFEILTSDAMDTRGAQRDLKRRVTALEEKAP